MKTVTTLGVLGLLLSLTACQQNNQANTQSTHESSHHLSSTTLAQPSPSAVGQTEIQRSASASAINTPINIDWGLIDSGVTRVDAKTFNYAFALDSQPVKAYMDAYQVDAITARYNLTVGMAVNEVLSKILDQIGTAYVSHELTAGKDSKFIIHTTQRVIPSTHHYVFAEPFARGLTIEVQILNDGKK